MAAIEKWASRAGGEKKKIEVFSREKKRLVEEVVYGDDLLRLAYGTPTGLRLTANFWAHRWLSWLAGLYYDSSLSRRRIETFAKQLDINLEECEKDLREYQTFNQFFARKLKPGSRPIDGDPRSLVSPGDGRLLVFPRIGDDSVSYVKWTPIQLLDLFNRDSDLVARYRGGACAVLRLCPSDYHRFHFPSTGLAGATLSVPGLLHSVNPYALEQKVPVFAFNKRTICSLATEGLGDLLILEIGALGVGTIIQTYKAGSHVARGQEKGYFKFGGSTTIIFAEPGKIEFDQDLVSNSEQGLETIVKMGEAIGKSPDATRI